MNGDRVRRCMFYVLCLMVCATLGACAREPGREGLEIAHTEDALFENQNEKDAFFPASGGMSEFPYTNLACGVVAPMPKGIALVLCVNGKRFITSGIAHPLVIVGNQYGLSNTHYGVLPQGYEYYGPVSSVTESEPLEELQMLAGDEVKGDVYVNKDYPGVIYAKLYPSWMEDSEPFCYRFVSDEMYDNRCICFGGSQYLFYVDPSDDMLTECPRADLSFQGNLIFVGGDCVPQADLETNLTNGTVKAGNTLSWELYSDPKEDTFIWLKREIKRPDGTKENWVECKKISQ